MNDNVTLSVWCSYHPLIQDLARDFDFQVTNRSSNNVDLTFPANHADRIVYDMLETLSAGWTGPVRWNSKYFGQLSAYIEQTSHTIVRIKYDGELHTDLIRECFNKWKWPLEPAAKGQFTVFAADPTISPVYGEQGDIGLFSGDRFICHGGTHWDLVISSANEPQVAVDPSSRLSNEGGYFSGELASTTNQEPEMSNNIMNTIANNIVEGGKSTLVNTGKGVKDGLASSGVAKFVEIFGRVLVNLNVTTEEFVQTTQFKETARLLAPVLAHSAAMVFDGKKREGGVILAEHASRGNGTRIGLAIGGEIAEIGELFADFSDAYQDQE